MVYSNQSSDSDNLSSNVDLVPDPLEAIHDEYARQITADFEEMAWLRQLVSQIEICDLDRDIRSVASSVLPSLQEYIRAESIALLIPDSPAIETGSTEAAKADNVLKHYDVAFMSGPLPVSDFNCSQFVLAMEPFVKNRPFVHNQLFQHPVGHHWRDVKSCILIRIAKNGRLFGWLLAVNCIPAKDRPETIGTIQDWPSEAEFGTLEAGLLHAAAILLATHAANVELLKERESLTIGVVRALINAIDAKDAYTRGHSDRVALVSRRLAEVLDLDPQECERVYMAGLLHDIGKIGVPDSVLRKPGKLDDHEFDLIKKHPQIGYDILKHVRQLEYVLPGVLHHHEAVDGRGYPKGLTGESIPLVGRILAVADAYDAMTSTRPYRSAMPAEKAEAILKNGRGQQWDATVIDAFFCIRGNIQAIYNLPEVAECTIATESSILVSGVSSSWAAISAAVNTIALTPTAV